MNQEGFDCHPRIRQNERRRFPINLKNLGGLEPIHCFSANLPKATTANRTAGINPHSIPGNPAY